jgi:peptide/nickel transport system substrate-binding protein
MPEHLAQESPFKPVSEVVGSGPYRFLKDEHVSGARAVFARFAEYRPRDGSKVGFTAGCQRRSEYASAAGVKLHHGRM